MQQAFERKPLTVSQAAAEREVAFVPFGAADEIKLSIKIIQNIVAVPTKSGATCSERDAMKFLMMCQAQRLNPFAGDAYLTGYDSKDGPKFSLITAVQVFYKRAETCQDYEGIDSGIILQNEDGSITEREGDFCLSDEEVVGGWAVVHRKGRKPMKARLSIDAMKPPYDTPFWSKTKAPGQICKCAEMDALRRSFPSLLGGLYIQGEMDASAMQIASKVVATRPIFDAPQRQIAPSTDNGGSIPSNDSPQPSNPDKAAAAVPTPESESATIQAPASAAAAPVKEGGKLNYVKAAKNLLAMGGFSEVELIKFLQDAGKMDDSIGTLKDMAEVAEITLKDVVDNFAWYGAELKRVRFAEEQAGKGLK